MPPVHIPDDGRRQADGAALHALFVEVFGLHNALSHVMDHVHSLSDLTAAQHHILSIIHDHAPVTVPDIAFRLHTSRQHVQQVCNTLQDKGLVTFEANPRHKRSKLVAMTPAGREALLTSQRMEFEFIQEHLGHTAGASEAGTRQAAALLRALTTAVTEGISVVKSGESQAADVDAGEDAVLDPRQLVKE